MRSSAAAFPFSALVCNVQAHLLAFARLVYKCLVYDTNDCSNSVEHLHREEIRVWLFCFFCNHLFVVELFVFGQPGAGERYVESS